MPNYHDDLSYIHHAGFGDFALGAAPGLLRMLQEGGVREGLVVDLGCGSGVWNDRDDVVRELRRAGFAVRVFRRYGDYELPPRRLAFRARRST